jgi:flagellar motor switch protein FliN/FliY
MNDIVKDAATVEDVAPAPAVAAASYSDLGQSAAPGDPMDVRLLADIPLNVTVELGRAEIKVRELLALREGSVVSLDKTPGSAVDIVVNGRLVARGDVVVVDDDFGVRITEVLDPSKGF